MRCWCLDRVDNAMSLDYPLTTGNFEGRLMTDRFRYVVGGLLCVYCGETANTLDHWPPRSYGDFGLLLPCCRECNTLLGTQSPTSLEARITGLKYMLRQRYQRWLRIPDWDEDDLRSMGKTLRSSIVTGLESKARVSKRLAWNAAAYLSLIDSTGSIAAYRVECEERMLNAKRLWMRTEPETAESVAEIQQN